ncbi:MAG: nitrilase-related carbon-nitrogen hydrolase [Anaerolineales bacterium]
MMKKFKIALAQIDTRLGEVEANLGKHLDMAKQAAGQDADLLVFPELSLTGYSLKDLVPRVARQPEPEDPVFGPLLEASEEIDLVVGYVEQDHRSRFFISAAYLSSGKVVHNHRKVYLPTYGLFQEGRFFAAGDRFRAFDTSLGRFGLLICEDFWHPSAPYLVWLDGADLLIFISASPSRGLTSEPVLSSVSWVERVNHAYAGAFTSFIAHTNRIGFEDGLKFGGRATVHNPKGELISHGAYHQEGLTYAEIEPGQLRRTRAKLPLLRDEKPQLVLRELDRILASKHRHSDR